MTKFTTETDARPMPLALSGSPIHASGAAVEGPRPSGAGSPITYSTPLGPMPFPICPTCLHAGGNPTGSGCDICND